MQIDGVTLTALITHDDERGSLTEIFRENWVHHSPVQWNHVQSNAQVLRGVHAHLQHTDYLVVLAGSALIGLHDLRSASPTYSQSHLLELKAAHPQSLIIPPGVAHGFYFPEPCVIVYSVTHYFQGSDELGCRWDDPQLRIPWPFQSATISPRDEALPSFAVFQNQVQDRLAFSVPHPQLLPDNPGQRPDL